MNRLFRMFGAKVALVVIALVLFAGLPEFGAMEAEAKPRRGRSAQKRKVKRGKSTRGRSRGRSRGKATRSRGRGGNRGKATRGRTGRGRNRGRVVRGGGRRRVIIKKVRGRNGRIYKRRIVVGGGRRSRSGRRTRRDSYTPSNTSNGSNNAVAAAPTPRRPVGRVVIPEDRAREIQAALKNAGYYQGDVTGNYDDATREAMRSFQRANGIKDTGMPTAPALLKLGLTKHKSDAGDTSAPSVTPPPPSQPDGTPNQ